MIVYLTILLFYKDRTDRMFYERLELIIEQVVYAEVSWVRAAAVWTSKYTYSRRGYQGLCSCLLSEQMAFKDRYWMMQISGKSSGSRRRIFYLITTAGIEIRLGWYFLDALYGIGSLSFEWIASWTSRELHFSAINHLGCRKIWYQPDRKPALCEENTAAIKPLVLGWTRTVRKMSTWPAAWRTAIIDVAPYLKVTVEDIKSSRQQETFRVIGRNIDRLSIICFSRSPLFPSTGSD